MHAAEHRRRLRFAKRRTHTGADPDPDTAAIPADERQQPRYIHDEPLAVADRVDVGRPARFDPEPAAVAGDATAAADSGPAATAAACARANDQPAVVRLRTIT